MSMAGRLALALVVLAISAGGVVIFYVLPQYEAPAGPAGGQPATQPEQLAAQAPPAPPTATPSADAGSGSAPPQSGAESPPPRTPDEQAPAVPTPAEQPPAEQAPPDQPPAVSTPADQPPSAGAGAPIPLAPESAAPAAPSGSAASAPFDPALPGVGNIAATVNQNLVMAGTADARTEPRADAPVLVRLDKGSVVTVSAVMAGQLWLQVELPDHRTAYIPAAALPQAVSAAGTPRRSAAATGPATPSFMADAETLIVRSRTPIYATPDAGAAVQGVLPAGTKVQIVAKTTDGKWGWLQTTDGSPSYIRMAALAPAAPASPDRVIGRPKVVTTATMVVGGRHISLYGIKGLGGAHAQALRALIESHGGVVTCTRRDVSYICYLPGDLDIARAALYNGGATPAEDASPDYREQADAARAAGRGVWAR